MPPSRLRRTFAGTLWIWFLIWTVFIAFLWIGGFGSSHAAGWVDWFLTPEQRAAGTKSPLQDAFSTLVGYADLLWILLAAMLTHASLTAERGLRTARRWMATALVVAALLGSFSLQTGALTLPLGAIHITERLGPRFGRMALGWPFLWCVVLFGARELVRRLFPQASHTHVAVGTGLLTLATAANLELVARMSQRGFWFWYPTPAPGSEWPPLQVYLAWFLFGALLANLFRTPEVVRTGPAPKHRGALILLMLNALCLTAHLSYRLRS